MRVISVDGETKILNNLYTRIQELSKLKSELIGVMNSRRNIAKDRSREMA